ncbi:MAG: hypothetical protein EBY78_06415 [Actinobacteria bacterium]|jgi:hypothetical protein|nr:hypothetical protein [Actinomycetota bacterium]
MDCFQIFGKQKRVIKFAKIMQQENIYSRSTTEYMKTFNQYIQESWSNKYKKSIDCNNPKGFSQKAHCQGRKLRSAGVKTKSKAVK